MVPVRALAGMAAQSVGARLNGSARPSPLSNLTAAYELIARAGLTHARPPYGIDSVMVGNREVAVTEEAADVTPFGTLLHFKKDIDAGAAARAADRAAVRPFRDAVARHRAHHAAPSTTSTSPTGTMRATCRSRTGASASTNISTTSIRFLETIGPGAHMVAVCQPCVAALVAAAVMAQADNPAQPRSMTLMAGPIDTRVNPTKVNELAKSKPIEWFEKNLIATVPPRYAGGGRRVYPGFVQLAAFMSMNIERHVKAHRNSTRTWRAARRPRPRNQGVLRRIFRRARSDRRILSGDREAGVPGARAAARRAHLPGSKGRAGGDPAHHAVHRGRREGRHLRGRARRWPRTTCARRCGPTASATTCRPASAITACSPAAPGRTRSIRW